MPNVSRGNQCQLSVSLILTLNLNLVDAAIGQWWRHVVGDVCGGSDVYFSLILHGLVSYSRTWKD